MFRPIAIVGPTGVGKSAVAERAALDLGGEIISADSMQVYRGMDIGTAKTPRASRLAAYHCIDLVDPGQLYSAALYQRDARAAIDSILQRHRIPIVVGGTGLYVRAALDEFHFPEGSLDTDLRRSLEQRAAEEGPEALHRVLAETDPAAAALIHPHNVRRTIRALEMAAQGRPYSQQAAGFAARKLHYPGTTIVGLHMERTALYARIDDRVNTMIAGGLLGEVERLLAAGYRTALTSMQAIGYKEIVPVVERGADLAEAIASVKQSSRRYAKRQLSWFRSDPRITWLDVTDLSLAEAVNAVRDLVESTERPRQEG